MTFSEAIAISIVTPTYNRAGKILGALQSVRRELQSVPFLCEMIVVDDGSIDGTTREVQEWQTKHQVHWLKYISLEKNSGVNFARNRGIDVARGEIVLFLDSDDSLLPGALKVIYKCFREHPQIGIYGGSIRSLSGRRLVSSEALVNRPIGFAEFLGLDSFPEVMIALRRSLLENPTRRYSESVDGFEQLFYLTLLKGGAQMWVDPTEIRCYDDEGEDRYCHPERLLASAQRLYRGYGEFLRLFGQDIKKIAPQKYRGLALRVLFWGKMASISGLEKVDSIFGILLWICPAFLVRKLYLVRRTV